MKFAVVQFPGSNCDQDCYYALHNVLGQEVRYVWHKDTHLAKDEVVILPGGFSYGDYLRCGAIARFSPIMKSVVRAANEGQIVIGICNGFQILCEAGLLPGALVRNQGRHFICEYVRLRVETNKTAFTHRYQEGQIVRFPIAHGEGRYVADPEVIDNLFSKDRVVFRYVNESGEPTPESNPNGATASIAGICSEVGNVMGLMPHPERACEMLLGGSDGVSVFQGVIAAGGKAL